MSTNKKPAAQRTAGLASSQRPAQSNQAETARQGVTLPTVCTWDGTIGRLRLSAPYVFRAIQIKSAWQQLIQDACLDGGLPQPAHSNEVEITDNGFTLSFGRNQTDILRRQTHQTGGIQTGGMAMGASGA